MTILVVYAEEPNFPATDQNPDAVRYQMGDKWVDAIGDEPTQDEVDAFLNPAAAPLSPSIYAVAALAIAPGDITGIDTSVNFAAALYMDVGSYLLFFTEAQENNNYLAKAYDDETRVRITEKGLDYIVVTVTDSDGNPADPAEISVEIIRVS